MKSAAETAGPASSSGIGLVEVVVALAVLAALAVPIFSLISTGTREAMISEDFILAEMLASRTVEEKLALDFPDLDDLVPRTEVSGAVVKPGRPVQEAVEIYRETRQDDGGYRMELAMRRITDDLLSLEVTVTWETNRRERKFALLRFRGRQTVSAGGRPEKQG